MHDLTGRYAQMARAVARTVGLAGARAGGLPAEGDELHWTGPDGRTVRYLRRRLLPQPESIPAMRRYVVRPGDRLDLISASCWGDPLQYWRIADANGVMDPFVLCEVGRTLLIPAPEADITLSPEAYGTAAEPPTGRPAPSPAPGCRYGTPRSGDSGQDPSGDDIPDDEEVP